MKNYRKGFAALCNELAQYKERDINYKELQEKVESLENENTMLKHEMKAQQEQYKLQISKIKCNYTIYQENMTKQCQKYDEQLVARNYIINQLHNEISKLNTTNASLKKQIGSTNDMYKLQLSKIKLNKNSNNKMKPLNKMAHRQVAAEEVDA